ncbi:hydroxyacid dehydrogenase [Pseudoroseomonas cervicalis]|uniref:hydroxyacid dehydrogenase n=1 Tax=Teichococcus cervicalis TaxID=204525 RepID=UPI00278B5CB7|nr:hydroxyacid dehydrogenase [Pseudoroseomonas cervicalis]MDQ1079432.1 D-3-phosphoglycerate dehydrogenase [Pseudoroseomonas cervicalis]
MPATPRPNVLVSAARLAPEAVAMLEEAGYAVHCTTGYPAEEELLEAIGRLRPVAILHRQGFINGTVMDAAAPELRVVARHGAGIDGIDIAAARARGLAVTRAAGANSRSVAEHAMALMLSMLKDLPSVAAGMREGLWEKTSRMTRDIDGMTLGIVGYGAIGSKVARYADAFGMRVLAYDPYLPGDGLPGPGTRVASLAELLPQAEVLSLHCPLEPETRGLIGAAELALLPRGAILVHTARGGIVDQEALLAALESGQLSWAGVDVFAKEPLDADSPLRSHPRVVPTPHLAANTPRGALGMACGAAESIIAVLAGRLPALEGAMVVPAGQASSPVLS